MPPKKKKLNPKQAKYINNRKAGKSKKESALAAGYSKSTANSVKNNIEKGIIGPLNQAMDEAGISDKFIAEGLKELASAKRDRVIYRRTRAATIDGSGKKVTKSVETTEIKEVPDHIARSRGLELIGKYKGAFIQKVEHSGTIDNPEVSSLSNKDLKSIFTIMKKGRDKAKKKPVSKKVAKKPVKKKTPGKKKGKKVVKKKTKKP